MASLFKACFKKIESELPDIEKMVEDAVEKRVEQLVEKMIKKYLEKGFLETEDVKLESYPHEVKEDDRS
jgi:hypothetical protein